MNSWYGIKKLSRNLFGSLLFALFIYTPAIHAEQFSAKSGEIRGTVYGQETGDPLINATVRLGRNGTTHPDRWKW